jgi:DNA-binding NarL/FixJ family response regulator
MKPWRVLIADDHEVVRCGVRALLEGTGKFVVCGEVGTGREAVAAVAELKPDMVVMDIAMPELNGLEATRQIGKTNPDVEILILTMHESENLVHEVLNAGARGYVLKADAGRDLVKALEALAQHKPFFTAKVTELVLRGFLGGSAASEASGDQGSALSPRERQIAQLVAEGKANKEIASILGISLKTAETHRANLMMKLDLHSVSDLVRYAIRNQIIDA